MKTLVALLTLSVAVAAAKPSTSPGIRAQIREEINNLVPYYISAADRAQIRASVLSEMSKQSLTHSPAWFRKAIRNQIQLEVRAFAPKLGKLAAVADVKTRKDPSPDLGASATPTPIPAVTQLPTMGVVSFSMPAPSAKTFVSVPLSTAPIYSAGVTQVTATTVIATGSSPFVAPAGSYFARFTSGEQAGRAMLVTSAVPSGNTTTFTLDTTDHSNPLLAVALNAASFSVMQGDAIEIFPATTVSGFFGTTATTGDMASIYNINSGAFDVYSYNGTHWLSAANFVVDSLVLYPEATVYLQRSTGASAGATLVLGSLPVVAPLTRSFSSGVSIYTSSRFPIDLTLGAMNLSGFTPATTPNPYTASTLSIFNAGTWTSYYMGSPATVGGPWWTGTSSATDYSNTVTIPTGSGFSVLVRNAGTGRGNYIFSKTLPYSYP